MHNREIPLRTRRRAAASDRRGAVTVELALVAPMFFMILFASIEFGRMNMLRHAAHNAAYEGARHAVVPGASSADAIGKANDMLAAVGAYGGSVVVNPTSIDNDTNQVKVTVTLPMNQNGWILPRFTANREIIAESKLRTERYEPVGS